MSKVPGEEQTRALRPRARLIDVAREAGVSRQTAGAILLGGRTNSRASDETIRLVRQAARRLNYRPNTAAQQLSGRTTGLTAVVCESVLEPTHALLVDSLLSLLEERGFTAVLLRVEERSETLEERIESLVERGVEGLLYVLHRPAPNEDVMQGLLDLCPRSVFYGAGLGESRLRGHFVDVDRRGAARLALRHLYDNGRRRPGFLSGHIGPHRLRHEGYLEEMAACGLERDDRLVFMHGDLHPDRLQANTFRPALRELVGQGIDQIVRSGGADAVLSGLTSPPLTLALLQELKRRGLRVPDDVAVVTVGDDPAYPVFRPSVSVVRMHHDRLAAPMVNMLEQMLEHDSHRTMRGLFMAEPELVRRESA